MPFLDDQRDLESPQRCPSEQEVLDYLSDAREASGAPDFEEHLSVCDRCRSLVSELVRTEDSLGALAVGPSTSGGAGSSADRRLHSMVGRYELLEVKGTGALGVVFSARDPELDRKVAIKMLRPGGDSRGRDRLVREGRAMARLRHENVRAVYDAGLIQDEWYVAMELVDGQDLREWLQESPRSWREIVEVFVQAARGLQAAHDAGIVHRDVKPDNILVSRAGRALVSDFGIAGAASDEGVTESAGSLAPSDLTLTGAVVGSPAYMAPELFDGHPASIQSDVYSLAVSLFEALEGRRPFAGASTKALLASKRSQTPGLSTRRPRWLRRIVERGLLVDPDQRPSSMNDFIRGLTTGQRRRRVMTAASIAAALSLAGAGLALSLGDDSDRCEVARAADWWSDARARSLSAALVERGLPRSVVDTTLGEVDDRTREWGELRYKVCRDNEESGSVTLQASAARSLCLERWRNRSAALLETLSLESRPEDLHRVAEALVAQEAPAACLDEQTPPSHVDRALIVTLDEIWALWKRRQLGDEDPRLAELDRKLELEGGPAAAEYRAELLLLRAEMAGEAANHERVRELLLEAAQMASEAKAGAIEARAWIQLLGLVGDDQLDLEQAEIWHQVARAASSRVADSSISASFHDAWGRVLRRRGKLEEAGAELEQAILLSTHPLDRARSHNNLAIVMREQGKLDAARSHYEAALRLKEEALGAGHYATANTLANLSFVLMKQDAIERAIETAVRARGIQVAAVGSLSIPAAKTTATLAAIYEHAGRYAEASSEIESSLKVLEEMGQGSSADVASILSNQGRILTRLGRLKEAESSYRRSLALKAELFGPESGAVAMTLSNLGQLLVSLGRIDEAVVELEKALATNEKHHGLESSQVASTLNDLALALVAAGRHDAAISSLRRSLGIKSKTLGPEHSSVAVAHLNLGIAIAEHGDCHSALKEIRRALEIFRKVLPAAHPNFAYVFTAEGMCLNRLRRHGEAAKVVEEAVQLRRSAQVDPAVLAESLFELAQAVWPKQPERARELAREAQTLYRKAETRTEPAVAVDQWLVSH